MTNILEILLRAKGGEQVKGELEKTNKAADSTKKIMTALGGVLSVGILAKGLKDSIKAYQEQELAVTKLNAALKAQNAFTEETSQSLQNQASALQQVTTFGDEAIISAQALLLNYGLTDKEVKKVIPTILDFAAATGKDVRQASDVVGRALMGQVSVLRTYGVNVDEAALKVQGMGAIQETLQSQFGGTAQAVAESGIGPMIQFSNTIGDVKERIGAALIPSLNEVLEAIKPWLPFIEKIALGIIGLVKTFITGVNNIAQIIDAVLKGKIKDIPKIYFENLKKVGNIWVETGEKMVEVEEEAAEKRVEIVKEETEQKLGIGDFWKKKVEEQKQKEIETEEKAKEKKLEIAKKETEEKEKIKKEEAEKLLDIQDRISQNLEDSLVEMIKSEKTFEERVGDVWGSIEDMVIRTLAKEVIETQSAAIAKIAASQGEAAAKAIAAHSGIPFVGLALGVAAAAAIIGKIKEMGRFEVGGTVPGARGEPRMAVVHGGERILTERQQREGMGGQPQIIFQINGTFLEADETKWQRLWREKLKPEMQRELRKTGEQFS